MKSSGICILSPHCDDALLALGGFILLHGNIDVIDVFATTAWTTLSETMTVESITAMNQAEEKRAFREAGATVKLIETREALMRGYTQWDDPNTKTSDLKLAKELWGELSARLKTYDEVYFPIAPGGHVDHRIVRQIVLDHSSELLQSGAALYCYEDLPYSWYGGLDEAIAFIRTGFVLKPIEYDIMSVVEKKMRLLRYYRSQLAEDDLAKVHEYALHLGDGQAKERVWQLQPR